MAEAPSLSVCVITLNEESNLPRCLASVREIAAEIVVVDSESLDRTREIAAAAGARVVTQPFLGHVRQKQLALEHARSEWVLSLDADEWLDDELRAAIAEVLHSPQPESVAGYKVNRRPFYLGRWIKASGWFPDWNLRLVRRQRAHWAGEDPHDRLEVDGGIRRLTGAMCHHSYVDIGDHVDRLNRYAAIAARSRKPVSALRAAFRMTVKPAWIFFQRLVIRQGFRDGTRGILIAGMSAFYYFLREARLWERDHGGGSPDGPQA